MSEEREEPIPNQIGFIGGGQMAEGIIAGLSRNSAYSAGQAEVFEILDSRKAHLSETYGIRLAESLISLVKTADVIVFAVRPQDARSVCERIRDALNKDTTLVSVCAGLSLSDFARWLGPDAKVARAMPNTLTEAQRGYTALCSNDCVTDETYTQIENVFSTIGKVTRLPENMFNAFTAFSCAGPAVILYFVNAMIDAGVRSGFSREYARDMVFENMSGTHFKLEATGLHPFQIIDTMNSPAGVGIESIYSLHSEGVYAGILESFANAMKRAEKLE